MDTKGSKHAITPTRQQDYPQWYQQVIRAADLAEAAPVRGCMVIKPWGYAIWERMQRVLDGKFKATGHTNAYFPLFIPLSYMEKEAEHVEGFAKECAIVTHHRLEPGADGGLIPAAPLEEPLVIRPTSETIIGTMYAKWVQSYRDLPILINQWANVVRWEMRPRLFLRTTEFLWQEGHTVHAGEQEAIEETLRMLDIYESFATDYMAMPVIKGEKTAGERFPGAVATYTIEAMMQDHKALQSGTSHLLGQNFSRAQEIKFLNQQGKETYAWTTSWGVSTRLIGGLIMAHSDDDGLILPPKLAPTHIVILPIYRNQSDTAAVRKYCDALLAALQDQYFADDKLRVEIDNRDLAGGEKVWQQIKRGVPIRLEIGPRDVKTDSVFMGRRDHPPREKESISRQEFLKKAAGILAEMQDNLLALATQRRDQATENIDDLAKFTDFFTPKNKDKPEIHGGFALCHWCDDPKVDEQLKKLKVSIRCIPVNAEKEKGRCVFTGKPSSKRVVFAKAY